MCPIVHQKVYQEVNTHRLRNTQERECPLPNSPQNNQAINRLFIKRSHTSGWRAGQPDRGMHPRASARKMYLGQTLPLASGSLRSLWYRWASNAGEVCERTPPPLKSSQIGSHARQLCQHPAPDEDLFLHVADFL